MKTLSMLPSWGLIFDNLRGISAAELQRETNLYALLAPSVVVSDSWALTNGLLQERLTSPGGVELLRSGVIQFARRNTVQSWVDWLAQARQRNMHALCATDQFAQFLDREAANPLMFDGSRVAATYKELSGRVLTPEFLVNLGVSEASAALVFKIMNEAKARGVDIGTNTFVKEFVSSQLPQQDGDLVFEAARAPYSVSVPESLGLSIVGPRGFRGDEILAALHGKSRRTGMLDVVQVDDIAAAAYETRISDALVNWLLSTDVLTSLTPSELLMARSVSDRVTYLRGSQMFLNTPHRALWDSLITVLEIYLRSAASEIFESRLKSGALGVEPRDGTVVVEGASTIKIRSEGEHVQFAGLKSDVTIAVAEMRIVGKELALPVVEEK